MGIGKTIRRLGEDRSGRHSALPQTERRAGRAVAAVLRTSIGTCVLGYIFI